MLVLLCAALVLVAPSGGILVSTEALPALDDAILVDARAAEAYGAGHIPGAVSLSRKVISEARDGVVNRLRPVAQLRNLLASRGIDPRKRVVVYSGTATAKELTETARLFRALEYLGYPRVSLLDGGYGKWVAEERPDSTSPPSLPPIDAEVFRLPLRSVVFADFENVQREGASAETALVDSRPAPFFLGQEKKGYVGRAGHVPGAANLPASSVLHDEHQEFRSSAEIETSRSRIGRLIGWSPIAIPATARQ